MLLHCWFSGVYFACTADDERVNVEEEIMTDIHRKGAGGGNQAAEEPGPNRITNEMLEHLGSFAKKILLKIYNTSWNRASVPQAWREAMNDDPGSQRRKGQKQGRQLQTYQPHQLHRRASGTAHQLKAYLVLGERRDHNTQTSWFRQYSSTEDQVTYLFQEIEDARQDNTYTLEV